MKKSTISMERQERDAEPDEMALKHAAALDFAEAEVEYKRLIAEGSVLSMVNLGSQYEFRPKNNGGPDFVQAESWYRKAVEAGSAVSTLPVGYFYLRRKDYEKAREIFSIGMDRGYAPSIARLADLYINGWGVGRDYAFAKELFEQAADLGNLWAKLAIAGMTVSLGQSNVTRFKGLLMGVLASFQVRLQRWRDPRSERLKK